MPIWVHKFLQTLQKFKDWFAWPYDGLPTDEGQIEAKRGKSIADFVQLVTCPVFLLLLNLAQWPHAEKAALGNREMCLRIRSYFLHSTGKTKIRTVFESQFSQCQKKSSSCDSHRTIMNFCKKVNNYSIFALRVELTKADFMAGFTRIGECSL